MIKPTTILILALFLLVLILGSVYFSSLKKDTVQIPQPTPIQVFIKPSPSPVASPKASLAPTPPSPAPSPRISTSLSKQQLINIMPIQTDEFNIEYFSNADIFIVTIKLSPYDQNRLKSEQWFKDRGVINFESLNIKWSSLRNVQ